MKKLPIRSEAFQYVEKSFKEWLDILGYAPTTVYGIPNHIREFFHYLESSSITQIKQIKTKHIVDYYDHIKSRTNQTRGGGLSNSSLNKHLQALSKFMDYLRQSGRLELPYLKIRWEEKDHKQIEVLSVDQIKSLYKAAEDHSFTPKFEAIAARDKAMLSVYYSCALRRNEGINLDVSDINFDRGLLHV